MKVPLFSIGMFFWGVPLSFSEPTPYLELLESAPWDSVFTHKLNDKELEEIDSICGWLNRSMKAESEYTYSPNGKYKMKVNMLPAYEEDDVHIEATYFDERGAKLWFDTLENVRPNLRPSGLTNDGRNLIAYDNYACGLTFYEVLPLPKYLGASNHCFDWGWEFLEQENLVFGLSGISMALYKRDGSLLWKKPSSPDRKELYDPKFSISKDEKAILVGCYDKALGEAWLMLLNLKGEETGRAKFSTDLFFTGYLRSVYVSSSEPRLAIAISDGALVCFDMKSQQKLWDYKFSDPNWWIGSADFSPDGKTIAAGINRWQPKQEKQHIQLFDTRVGILQGKYVNIDESFQTWHQTSIVKFTKDGKFLIAATPNRKYLFRVNYGK